MYETKNELYERINNIQERINNVISYINENPDSDPNAYEMNELMFEVAQIGQDGRKFESTPYAFLKDEKYRNLMQDFNSMMRYRKMQLEDPSQGLCSSRKDPLYKYFDESQERMATLNSLGNKEVSNVCSKACGINLYIKQRKRNLKMEGKDEPIYDNFQELNALKNDINTLQNKKDINKYNLDYIEPIMQEIELEIQNQSIDEHELYEKESDDIDVIE